VGGEYRELQSEASITGARDALTLKMSKPNGKVVADMTLKT